MELKQSNAGSAWNAENLLIVLNGIETSAWPDSARERMMLLIVLNGIETTYNSNHIMQRRAFNRTKWN